MGLLGSFGNLNWVAGAGVVVDQILGSFRSFGSPMIESRT